MSDIAIVFAVVVAALALFIWNRIPAVIVAIGVTLALFLTGIVSGAQALAGFGEPVVVLIAGLFVIGAGLEAAGVTAWAGQLLVERAGGSETRAFVLVCALAALATATISVNGTVAALMPVVIVVALRLGMPTSQLLIPLCFASHSATMLTLLGAPLNVIASNTAEDAGYGAIGFFEFAVAGVPIFAGAVLIMLATYRLLLPKVSGDALPGDFSAHAQTLVEQYGLADGVHRLRVRGSSPLIGQPREALGLGPDLALVAVQDGASGKPLAREILAEGDLIVVRGDRIAAGRLATGQHLAFRSEEEGAGGVAETLFNRGSGLAEVLIPPRSKLIGQTVFPGMTARGGELMVLAVQRSGADVGAAPTQLQVGDHLLLQGTWQALDKHLADPQVIVVDSPEVVRRQAVPLGHRAWEAIAVLAALIVLLAGGWFPAALVSVACAVALVLLRVLTVPQAYKGIDWNTCILIGGMIPLSTAMLNTGAAQLIADGLIAVTGDFGPRALLAGLFVVTLVMSQLMSNTAAALVMLPIATVAGPEMGVSSMPAIFAVTIGAHAAVLTPIATPVNLMVMGPGGYKFGDYWKFGLPLAAWSLLVVLFVVPLYWRF